MNAYKKLLKNSGVFAIANLGSKLISIILVPFYTYVLSTKEYGTIDIIMTNISLVLPMITLSIFDAALRFTVKSEYEKSNIFTSSTVVVMLGNVVFLLAYPFVSRIKILDGYVYLFYIVLFFQALNSVFSQFARGIGKVKVFATSGVVNTFITLILNIL
ncbi:MAG: oligosaccharide flippase family protein, partial [Clostridiaceae bacterium]|nr:oligosaccharide flippase family protein [Clostridiaceae bacterium]